MFTATGRNQLSVGKTFNEVESAEQWPWPEGTNVLKWIHTVVMVKRPVLESRDCLVTCNAQLHLQFQFKVLGDILILFGSATF